MPNPSTPAEEVVPATLAPDRLGAMLDECLRGKSFTISRYGRPAARLVPIEEPAPEKGRRK